MTQAPDAQERELPPLPESDWHPNVCERAFSVDDMLAYARAARALPQTASEPTDALDGNLWSFLRSTLSQGGDILIDYQDRPYEERSARLDLAARERVLKLHAAMAERPAEGGSNG